MPHPLTLGTADVTEREIELVTECLRAKRLSPGAMTQRFEAMVAEHHGLKYATYCNSGQSALHLCLEALKLQMPRLKRVLVPAMTYISTLHAVWNAGLQVVLCDVNPQSGNLDLSQYHGGPYDAIIPVHLFGKTVRLSPTTTPIIEDACEAFGAPRIGYGLFTCLSFYVAHTITTGVGGMVMTNEAELNEVIKRLCNHGRVRGSDLYAGLRIENFDPSIRFTFNAIGFSYKLGDLNAALGVGQMERIHTILATRRTLALSLIKGLQDLPLELPDPTDHTFMMLPLVCRNPATKAALVEHLHAHAIETRDLMPVTTQPIVRQVLGDLTGAYPHAERLTSCGFYVGVHQHLTPTDCTRVLDAVHTFPFNQYCDPGPVPG